MLNRKESKLANGAQHRGSAGDRGAAQSRGNRRRFVISPKAHGALHAEQARNGARKANHSAPAKPGPAGTPAAGRTRQPAPDLTETIKTLVHLAHEHGHVTYDDINDILPEGMSPEDLDELYTKLRSLDVEIVDHAEVERAKPAEPEEEEDHRLEVLDDPVRMYMNQMGKVPLLTREQEVEICKRIEEAEGEMKRLVYSLGFTAKEHIAIAEKLLSEPPKERFDRMVVDKKVSNREGHLRELRKLIKKVRVLDNLVDEKYAAWQKLAPDGHQEGEKASAKLNGKKPKSRQAKLFSEVRKLDDMIVVAGNVHEKFKNSLRHIEE